jgi:hypothetical protein
LKAKHMMKFSSGLMSDIAFETHWAAYRDALFRINPLRYRGLGEARSKDFAKQAYVAARALGIDTVGGICWYLIPCSWLGLHFGSDPRYVEIARRLAGDAAQGDEHARIDAAGQVFRAIAAQTTGLEGERVPDALRRSQAQAAWIADTGTTPDGAIDILLDAWDVGPDARRSFPKADFLAGSAGEISHADLRGDAALKTHVVIGFWLGLGFLRDPQFAWAADAVAEAKSEGHDPVAALAFYAQKRLDRVMSRHEGVA